MKGDGYMFVYSFQFSLKYYLHKCTKLCNATSKKQEQKTLALSIQDLHQKLMHLLKEITSQNLFPSGGASIFGQYLVLTMQFSTL